MQQALSGGLWVRKGACFHDLWDLGVRHYSDYPQLTSDSCDVGCVCDVLVVLHTFPAPSFYRDESGRDLHRDPWRWQIYQTREVHSNFATTLCGFPVASLVTPMGTGAIGNLLLLPY